MTDIVAIIPARSGSKTIHDKNIQILDKHPLIAYSIAAAKSSKSIDRVIVSTNSKKYAEIAKFYGAEVPFIRPDKYATDLSIDRDFLIHAIKWLHENEGKTPEYWVHLRPTTPLRDPKIIQDAIKQIKTNKSATSLRSGHRAPESPFKWLIKENQYFKGISNSYNQNLPKEAFDQVYIPNGYVDIIKASYILNNEDIHGEMMIGFESPVCTEIDSNEEFDYIKFQLQRSNCKIKEYLNQYKPE